MKRLMKVVAFLIVAGGWPIALSAIHVVRTPGQLPVVGSMLPDWGTVHVFTKENLGFKQTFADTRNWTLEDIANRPILVSRMATVGLADAFAAAGKPDDVTAAMHGEVHTPVVPAAAPTPAHPAAPAKPQVEPVHAVTPATQPVADHKSNNVFDF